MSSSPLLTAAQVASKLCVTSRTVLRWVREGQNEFPRPIQSGGKMLLFPRDEVEQWIESRPRGSRSRTPSQTDSAPRASSPAPAGG